MNENTASYLDLQLHKLLSATQLEYHLIFAS